MPPKIRVAIAGASGETGKTIVEALLASPGQFEVKALVRSASSEKPEYTDLKARGVAVVIADLSMASEALTSLLVDMDVVISTLTVNQVAEEKNLATAAKNACVGRFVPSFFGPVCPPRGVMAMRAIKEDILDHIKKMYLPYTAIDVGWWTQLSLPRPSSGKFDKDIPMPIETIMGGGNVPIALTDKRNIGNYVARVISDPRTLNKFVFAYDEVLTQKQVFDLLEKVSGEKVPRISTPESQILASIVEAEAMIASGNKDFRWQMQLAFDQYQYSWGIRGDNSPEHAAYLGYLSARDLYPDFQGTKIEDCIRDILESKHKPIYSGRY